MNEIGNDEENMPSAPQEERSEDYDALREEGLRRSAQRRSRAQEKKQAGLRARFVALATWQKVLIAVPVAALALVLVFSAVELLASAGRVHPGVKVAGVPVGGLTTARATEALDEELSARMAAPVVLEFEEDSWTVAAVDVAASLDTTTAVESAMAVGRTGTFGDRVGDRFMAWFRPVELKAAVEGDAELIDDVMASVEESVTREPRDAAVVIEGTEARIEPSEVGIAVQRDIVIEDLLEGFACDARNVAVAAEFVPVSVTEEDAEQALQDALKLMAGPVTVTYEERSWEFEPATIASWIDFRPIPLEETSETVHSLDCDEGLECTDTVCVDASGTVRPHRMMLEAFISADEASQTVYDTVGEAGSPAVDAQFKANAGNVEIVPHKDGTGPDVEALATSMRSVLLGDGERVVALRTTRVEPEITTEVAKEMGIKERIATYTTTYSSGNRPRVNNIHVLADMLDGTLVAPGETFSFNGTIGPRTTDKGFQAANAIVNGELVPQLGGGICQVATTFFNSIYESGLPVLERKNHSLYISSYPKGRDAAVSWSAPDLKFKNDTDKWVLIATGYSNSSVTISLYGTDPGYDVTSEVGSWTNIKDHPVEEVEDDTLPEGSRVTETSGADGRTITVKRIVKKDGELVREDSFRSVYRTKKEIVRVGTKESSPTVAP